MVGKSPLSEEELATTLVKEIETILKSRPVTQTAKNSINVLRLIEFIQSKEKVEATIQGTEDDEEGNWYTRKAHSTKLLVLVYEIKNEQMPGSFSNTGTKTTSST